MLAQGRERLIRLLRWSERYTKTDMLYLAQGGFWLSVGQGAASVSALVMAIAFANLLPAETYGTYKYVLSIVGILAIPTLGGMSSALIQAIARGYEGSVIPGFAMRVRWGMLGSLGSIALAGYYYLNGNMELALAFAIAAPFIPLTEALGMYSAYLSGKKLFDQQTKYFIVTRLVYVGALFATLLLTDNLYIILAAYFVPLFAVQLALFIRTLRRFPPNRTQEDGTLRYGVHLSANDLINQIGLYLDSVLLFHYLGPVGVSVYTFAQAPMRQLRSGYKNMQLLALPKLAARTTSSINEQLGVRLAVLVGLGLALAGAYALAAPYLYMLLFPQYMESVIYSQVAALVLVLELPMTLLWPAVQSRLNFAPRWWLYANSIPSAIFIVSMVILIPTFGIWGVIISKLISTTTSLVVVGAQWLLFTRMEDTLTPPDRI